ncbi:MAG: amino acid deaminase/aldolase [Bacteroidetes bacterium]|nr:amino acid deaminase/aldolase [Bacteroidota bacterium]
MPDYQYYHSIFEGQQMPLAYVDLDLLEQNTATLAKRSNGKQIRIASKSIRCLPIIERILKSDPIYKGVMSFTADEALFLLENRLDDILIAYPVVHIPHIQALAQKVRKGATVYLMVDRPEHIDIIEEAVKDSGIKIPICIDIDMSVDLPGIHFGVWRSSIRSIRALKKLTKYALRSNAVEIRSLMGYEAQIAGVGDDVSGKLVMNNIIKGLKAYSIPKIAKFRAEAVDYLLAQGVELDLVNGGGTGSMESTTAEEVVTEVTVGSGFYNSHLFDNYSNFKLQPAAGFAIPISRIPKRNTYTCLGGGYIASGAVEPVKAPIPYLPKGASLVELEGAGEVQTPIVYSGKEKLEIGDPVFMRHSKAGELCERFNELFLIKNGKIVEKVKTYRGEGHCFL